MNQILTFLGYLHISFQPFITHLATYAAFCRKGDEKYWHMLWRLCLTAAGFLLVRFFLGYFGYFIFDAPGSSCSFESGISYLKCGEYSEWLRGSKLCTFSGKYHLGWSIPMASPSYYLPATFIHFFLMIVPFFIFPGYNNLRFFGLLLLLTGPVFSSYLTNDIMEAPSVWCLFSITQIIVIITYSYFYDQDFRKRNVLNKVD